MRKSFTLRVYWTGGDEGRWEVTSPDVPGLLVTGKTLIETLVFVPHAIDELDRLPPAALDQRRRAVVRAHADAAKARKGKTR